jgi:hypothetical protein
MNTYDLMKMHENLFQMVEDLYDDDKECEGNQMLASNIMTAVQIIEAELSLRESVGPWGAGEHEV